MRLEDVFEASPVVPKSNTGFRFRAGGSLLSVPASNASHVTISASPRPYTPQRPAAAFEQSSPSTPNMRFSQSLGMSPLPVGPEKTSGGRSRWDNPVNASSPATNHSASPAITISSSNVSVVTTSFSPELPIAPALASISAEAMPENVKAYLFRAFAAANQSEEQKNEMQRILLAKLEHAIKNGLLFSIDWDHHPIPSLPPLLGTSSYPQPHVSTPPIERPSWLKPASPRGAPRGRGGPLFGSSFRIKAVTPGTSTTPFTKRKTSHSNSRSRSRSPSKRRTRKHRRERSASSSRSRSRSRSPKPHSKTHSRSRTHSHSSHNGSSSSKSDDVQVVESYIPLNTRGLPRGGRRGKMVMTRGRGGLTVSLTGSAEEANFMGPTGKLLGKKARKALRNAVAQNPAELERRAQRFARHLNQNGGGGSDGMGEGSGTSPAAGVRARLGQRARLIGPGGHVAAASFRSGFPSQSVGAYRTSGGFGASDDLQFDWSSCLIVGTCEDIEKQYLRLTTVLHHL